MIYLVIALTISQGFGTWALLRFLAQKDDRFMRQVERLCVHIQAPERAVQQHLAEATPLSTEPLHTTYDSDEAYWKAQERYE